MDLGCYSLHAHRMLAPWAGGPPRVVAARDGERAGHPGVDEWLEADLEFPGGATGGARCSMAGEEVRMTCRIVGDRGEATAANFALATMELIDACYRAAGFPPRPRSRREQASTLP